MYYGEDHSVNDLPKPQGRYVLVSTIGERFKTYVPLPLSPEPSLQMEGFLPLLERVTQVIGRLDRCLISGSFCINTYQYVLKEALPSSQIEGTQSSFSDLLLHDNKHAPEVPLDDLQEVSAYVGAMEHGFKRIKADFPLSLRLIREIYAVADGNSKRARAAAKNVPEKPKLGWWNSAKECFICASVAR